MQIRNKNLMRFILPIKIRKISKTSMAGFFITGLCLVFGMIGTASASNWHNKQEELYATRGLNALSQAFYKDAEKSFANTLRHNEHPYYRLKLAQAQLALGKRSEAMENLALAAQDYHQARDAALTYVLAGNSDIAISILNMLRRSGSVTVRDNHNMALAYGIAGDIATAQSFFPYRSESIEARNLIEYWYEIRNMSVPERMAYFLSKRYPYAPINRQHLYYNPKSHSPRAVVDFAIRGTAAMAPNGTAITLPGKDDASSYTDTIAFVPIDEVDRSELPTDIRYRPDFTAYLRPHTREEYARDLKDSKINIAKLTRERNRRIQNEVMKSLKKGMGANDNGLKASFDRSGIDKNGKVDPSATQREMKNPFMLPQDYYGNSKGSKADDSQKAK